MFHFEPGLRVFWHALELGTRGIVPLEPFGTTLHITEPKITGCQNLRRKSVKCW